jgi:hypothetical protein
VELLLNQGVVEFSQGSRKNRKDLCVGIEGDSRGFPKKNY